MFTHYLMTAWRNFLRHKTSTSISVLGLSLGLGCFIAAVGAITYLDGADRHVANADRVVMIFERRTSKQYDYDTGFLHHTSRPLAQAMRREFPRLQAVSSFGGGPGIGTQPTTVDGRTTPVSYESADADYLRVLNWPRLHSSAENPLDVPFGVVLGENTARQLFGSTNVAGRTLQLPSGANLTVTAVLRSPPRQSHIGSSTPSLYDIEAVISDDTAIKLLTMAGRTPSARSVPDQWSLSLGTFTYAMLLEDKSLTTAALEERLTGIAERNGAEPDWQHEFRVVPLSKAWVKAIELNFLPLGSGISITTTLLLLATLVLGIACANYATLAFAQALRRAKETGVRRVVGATRAQLGAQALAEASCHVVVAIVIALAWVTIVGLALRNRTGIDALSAIAESGGFWVSLTAMALLVSVVAGLYPAFILTRIRPSQMVRANSSVALRGRGASVFLGIQFAVMGSMLSVLLVVYQQNANMRDAALAAHANEQIYLGAKWAASRTPFDTWRTELLRSPVIKAVSATGNKPWTNDFGFYPFALVGRGQPVSPMSTAVQYDFEKALDFKLLAGRSFDREFGDRHYGMTDTGQVTTVIDETLAKALGFATPDAAVGQVVRRHDSPGTAKIIGVVKDQPMRFMPFLDRKGNAYQLFPGLASTLIIRIDPNRLDEALAAIDTTWKKLNPAEPVETHFVNALFENTYVVYGGIDTILTTLTIIAVLIAALGGLGFATFVAGHRAHEIGVRKTLGARTNQVVLMLLKDFSKPVLVANLLTWPLAYFAAQQYLQMFVQRIDVTARSFVLSLVLSLLISSLAVSNRVYRAARLNPADVLRHE